MQISIHPALLDLLEKIFFGNRRIAERSTKGMAIDLRMKWKNYPSTVPMFHLHMTALVMDSAKPSR